MQGPLEHTTVDFWDMVWTMKSPLVFMLTSEVEPDMTVSCKTWTLKSLPCIIATLLDLHQPQAQHQSDIHTVPGTFAQTCSHGSLMCLPAFTNDHFLCKDAKSWNATRTEDGKDLCGQPTQMCIHTISSRQSFILLPCFLRVQ